MDNFARESKLSEKELAILYGELANTSKSTGAAYLLWFFLGGLGVHRFYLDSYIMGMGILFTQFFALICLFTMPALSFILWFIVGSILVADLFMIPTVINQTKEKRKAAIIERLIDSRRDNA